MDSDGANQRQLTHAGNAHSPLFTPDGGWIVYSVMFRQSPSTCWKVPVAGGEPVLLFPAASQSEVAGEAVLPRGFEIDAVSPDGRWGAGTYPLGKQNGPEGAAVVAMDGTRPWRELKLTDGGLPFSWTRNGRALAHVKCVRGGGSGDCNVWLQPLDGGPATQLTFFSSGGAGPFAWSRDGRQLAAWNWETGSDVVLITDDSKGRPEQKR